MVVCLFWLFVDIMKIGIYGDIPHSVEARLAHYGTLESIQQNMICESYDLVVIEVSKRDQRCRELVSDARSHDGDVRYLCHRDALTDEHEILNNGPWFVIYHETDPNPLSDRIDGLMCTYSDTKTIYIYAYDGTLWYEVESRTVDHRLAIVEPVYPVDIAADEYELGAQALVCLSHVQHDLPADTDRRDNVYRYVIEPMGCASREELVHTIPGCAVQTTHDENMLMISPLIPIACDGLKCDKSRSIDVAIDNCADIGVAILRSLKR